MNLKRSLFEGFHERMEAAVDADFHLEASWYCYAMIEDRLSSLLRNSGGIGRNGSSTAIRMIGPKLRELADRAANDQLLASCFPYKAVDDWKERRNTLMHAMADGSLSQAEIDKRAYLLSQEGQKVLRELSAAAMRLKKHRQKAS